MITFKNYLSNLNFNHIFFTFLLISFFYLKNLINKLIIWYQLNIIIFNKLYNKINNITKKNKKNYNKFNKKLKKNYKKIKKIYKENNKFYLKHISNNESYKNIEIKPTTPIYNIVPVENNCITVDEENEFEIIQ
jgi:hypothetical protein